MYQPKIEAVIPLPAPIAFALGARLAPRPVVEAMIEQLIAALDETDGDADIEPNGDEQEDSEALQHLIDHRGRFYGFLAIGDGEEDEHDYLGQPHVPEGEGAALRFGSFSPDAAWIREANRTRVA
jgi:hypothetical protein